MMFRTRPRVFVLLRRWKLANPATGIRAKISHGKVSMVYGRREKTLAAYSRWRASHPEIAKIEDEINALQWLTIPKRAIIEPGKKRLRTICRRMQDAQDLNGGLEPGSRSPRWKY